MIERELAAIARELVRFMPERARIERPTPVVDRYGASTPGTLELVADGVPCRITDARSVYANQPEHVRLRGSFLIVVPSGTDVAVGDVLTVGTRRYRVVDLAAAGTLAVTTRIGAEVQS